MTGYSICLTPAAARDVVDIATYIGRQIADAANRFLDAMDETTASLSATPELGQLYVTAKPRLQGLRVVRIAGYSKYLLFYIAAHHEIQVVRVSHGARDVQRLFD